MNDKHGKSEVNEVKTKNVIAAVDVVSR